MNHRWRRTFDLWYVWTLGALFCSGYVWLGSTVYLAAVLFPVYLVACMYIIYWAVRVME